MLSPGQLRDLTMHSYEVPGRGAYMLTAVLQTDGNLFVASTIIYDAELVAAGNSSLGAASFVKQMEMKLLAELGRMEQNAESGPVA